MRKVLKVIVVGVSVLLSTLPAYAGEAAVDQVKQETAAESSPAAQVPVAAAAESLPAAEVPVTPAAADTKAEPAKERTRQVSKEQIKGLDEQVQEIKTDVLGLAAQLNRLEEKLLYPSDTQVAIFVSLAPGGEKFRLDAVDIELDGKQVAHHLYTYKELEALKKGGVQRIHVGNIRTGEHPLQVTVTGKTEGGSDFRKEESFKVTKGIGPKLVGVVLAGTGIGSKTITVKDW